MGCVSVQRSYETVASSVGPCDSTATGWNWTCGQFSIFHWLMCIFSAC